MAIRSFIVTKQGVLGAPTLEEDGRHDGAGDGYEVYHETKEGSFVGNEPEACKVCG
jgi:hypothetical protein